MRDSQRFQLSDVGRDLEDEGHDATVMVAAKLVAPFQEGTPSPFGFLRVWDGTGPPTCDAYVLAWRSLGRELGCVPTTLAHTLGVVQSSD